MKKSEISKISLEGHSDHELANLANKITKMLYEKGYSVTMYRIHEISFSKTTYLEL